MENNEVIKDLKDRIETIQSALNCTLIENEALKKEKLELEAKVNELSERADNLNDQKEVFENWYKLERNKRQNQDLLIKSIYENLSAFIDKRP